MSPVRLLLDTNFLAPVIFGNGVLGSVERGVDQEARRFAIDL